MAHKKGHKMNMGSKEKNTPGTFSEKDTKTISKSTVGKMSDGVVVSGDKSKVNNKVNVPTAAERRAKQQAKIAEVKKIRAARIAEVRNERNNMRQVQKDKILNQKKQIQRKREGKDYQKPDGTIVRRRVKIVKN